MIRPGLELTSREKVMWPSTGFTKGDLLDYYARVAAVLLPHLADRPLTLGRFPGGIEERGFAQTECRGSPEWVRTAPIRLRDGRIRNFCLASDAASLLWIANLGTVELHIFMAAVHALDQPKAVLFDLDPEPPAGLAEVCRVALLLRERLGARGLTAVVKTTGGAGLHVVVPLNRPHPYAQTREFARRLAHELARDDDQIVASATRRVEREGTVLIDWAQNSERRSVVAPYSLRAGYVPLVSAPVAWEEVEPGNEALLFGPDEVLDRIARVGDLFSPALNTVQILA
jgi:bifunctional non-homologous end joining protein LigD